MKKLFLILVVFLTGYGAIQAQQLNGRVIDEAGQPIEAVAVVLQTIDSLFVDAALTDSSGLFVIKQSITTPHRLILQYLLYETIELSIQKNDVEDIQLSEKNLELAEVVVRGERPLVRVENGALSYDMPQLLKDKTATNAFEAIKELPGIMEQDNSLSLVGARSLAIVINGQATSMTMEQLIGLLKSVPASRVQKAEVLYTAPARYNIKGAVINVVLDSNTSETPALQGEAGAGYEQKHYASGNTRLNLLYSTPKLTMDLLLNGSKGKSYSGEDIFACHTMDGMVTEIDQHSRRVGKGLNGNVRLNMDYHFDNKSKLSASYYIQGRDTESDNNAITTFFTAANDSSRVNLSNSNTDGGSTLQNARVQFDGYKGLQLGADFTHYSSPSTLFFTDNGDNGTETKMKNETDQKVSRYTAFANQSHQVGKWGLNYGLDGSYAVSDNKLDYYYDTGNGYQIYNDLNEDNTQKDYIANAFVDASAQLTPRLSAKVAAKVEYFKSDYRNNTGERTTLWEDWTLFPTASLSYTFTPYHILQLNVNSDKVFPTYWQLSPQEVPLNSYSVVVGNPLLKPYRSYETQLLYIFRQKYILLGFFNYEPDYFTQVPYQSDTEMKNVFRYENFDYHIQSGLSSVIPFNVGKFWNSRLTLTGVYMKQKSDHFHSMSFDKKSIIGQFSINNTFNLSDKPNIKLTVDGLYVTSGAIQGIYDLGYIYTVSAGLRYTFDQDRATVTLTANDIFRSGYPNSIQINEGNQWSRMTKLNDTQLVRLSFTYKFGGYKARQYKEIDTSRLGN